MQSASKRRHSNECLLKRFSSDMANLLETSPTLDHCTASLVLSVVYATDDRPVKFAGLPAATVLAMSDQVTNFRQTLARTQFKLSRL
jgi:hypothetical protein